MAIKILSKAPTRIDLAGGTLDIWPLYLFLRNPLTVNVGIDLHAEARLVPKLGPLDRLMPTENSESPVAAFGEGPGLFERAAAALGLSTPGVLTMPDVRLA